MSDLNEIILLVTLHHNRHPDHGLDCACMDKLIAQTRKLFEAKDPDPKVQRRVDYVLRSALER